MPLEAVKNRKDRENVFHTQSFPVNIEEKKN